MNRLSIAKRVINTEISALHALENQLDNQFSDAVEAILNTSGRTIICGMGKSGIIGKKISASFASTGTPSFFMHPGEAFHGDLGMVTPSDVFIAISNSGETDEVLKLLPFLKDNGNQIIAITGNPGSTLAKNSKFHLNIAVPEEACPLQLAPTSSTTATLVMGDALTVALMQTRGFKPESFAKFHPGGSLGRRLLHTVNEEMVVERLPLLAPESTVLEIIRVMSKGGIGMAVVVLGSDNYGVITDGDIRRSIETYGENIFSINAMSIMSRKPLSVSDNTKVKDALILMDKEKVSNLLVLNDNKLVGVFKK